jgi:hypothetical protein
MTVLSLGMTVLSLGMAVARDVLYGALMDKSFKSHPNQSCIKQEQLVAL